MSGPVRVCRSEALAEGAVVGFDHGGRRYGVARIDGRLRAFDARCPHLHADLSEGLIEGDGIACPDHLWRFDLATGACTMVPGYAIPVFPAREVDGWVLVEPGP